MQQGEAPGPAAGETSPGWEHAEAHPAGEQLWRKAPGWEGLSAGAVCPGRMWSPLLGDTQKLSGDSPGQPALGGPASAGGGAGRLPEVADNLSCDSGKPEWELRSREELLV